MASDKDQEVTSIDGTLDFSGGVNSYIVPTIQSQSNPNGLKRNQLAWMDNCTVRGGGVTQRAGWKKQGPLPDGAVGLYQGKFMYEPDSESPYEIMAIGGRIWKVDVDNPANAVDLSAIFTDPTAAQTVTGQVLVSLTQTSAAPAIGTFIAGSTNSVIGTYKSFFAPGIGNTVLVPVLKIYAGALAVNIHLGGAPADNLYDITASTGWVPNPYAVTDLVMPPDLSRYYFAQAEQFLIIQAGDLVTLPLFWDGVILRRSAGLSGTGPPPASGSYGDVVLTSTANFTVPALAGTVTVPTTSTYTGVVGEYLSLLASYISNGSMVEDYSYSAADFIVTAIGANSITLKVVGAQAPFTPGTIAGAGATFVRLNFVNQTPWSGQSAGSGIPEIPPAVSMDYYMGRLWYAQGRQYSAGDIVGGSSGTAAYNFRDAVLKVTENPLAVGGDGFTVPTNAGNIRALKHSANINTQLGQGQLFIFTRRAVYALNVPVTRTDWIAAGNANQPLQVVVQLTNGAVNDRSVAAQNGDLFFQSFEPAIRSLLIAVRNFTQYGNVPISINESRILRFNDRSLMQFSSGISFDNRMLQTALPVLTPVGAASNAIIPLNFDVISTLEQQLPPVWEGMYEGMPILELSTGDFGGRPRAFATVWSDTTKGIELWELTDAEQFENGDNRVVWFFETPAFTWGNEFQIKKLVSAELWIDRIFGEVMYSMEYRPDSTSCWYPWHQWKLCTARDSCEDVNNPQCLYPQKYGESFKQTISLPTPTAVCQKESGRPSNIGFQFQFRLNIKGFCRIRGLLFKAEIREQELFGDMVC